MQIAIGASDAIAARTIDRIRRCDALWISSFELSTSAGLADSDMIGLPDLAARVSAVCRASEKPILVDASNGECLGLTDLAIWARTIGRDITLVIDDTAYPRKNSFTNQGNQLVSVSVVRSRLRAIVNEIQAAPNVHLCFRTEYYYHTGDLFSTVSHVAEVINGVGVPLTGLLVHGYDTVRLGLEKLRQHLGALDFVALSTLSPGSHVSDFEDQGVSIVVIPSILTVQRYFEGPTLIQNIVDGACSVDGPYSPFVDIVGELQFEDNKHGSLS